MDELVLCWWAPPCKTPEPQAPRVTWCDVWDALFGRLETFYRVELFGAACFVEAHEVGEYPPEDFDFIEPVRMTRRQFEALPEFAGW